MTYIPTQAGFMQLQDSALLLRAVFPNYPEIRPCNPMPVLEVAAAPFAAPVGTQSYRERRYFCLAM
jgi:hypothetical protein